MVEEHLDAPVQLIEKDGKFVLVLRGSVDIFWAEKLHHAALSLSERERDVVVSCESAEKLTVAAFQILLALKARVELSGGHFSVGTVSPAILQQLDLAGLKTLLLGNVSTE